MRLIFLCLTLFCSLFLFSLYAQETVRSIDKTTSISLLEPTDFYKKNSIPLSLQQVIFKTLGNNLQIRISDYDRRIAEAEIMVQKGIFDLILNANLSAYNNEYQQPTYDNSYNEFVAKEKKYGADASLSQLILTGGVLGFGYYTNRYRTNSIAVDINPYYTQGGRLFFRQPLLKNFGSYMTLSGIRIAQNSALMSREAFRSMVEDQIAEVTKAYWNLVSAIKTYEVQCLTLYQAQDFLRITTVSYKTGVVPESDVLQAKAQVAEREENVITAESAIKAMEDQLQIFMNIPRADKEWEQFYLPTDEPDVHEIPLDANSFIETAFNSRPDYMQMQIDLKNKQIARNVARNRRLPELNLTGSAGRSGLGESHSDAWHELNTYDYHNYEVGLELEFPLQNRAARYRYKQAILQFEKSELTLKNLENLIILEIRNAVRNIQTDLKHVTATQSTVEAEKAKLDSESQRYRVGLSTSFNVLTFQKDYAEGLMHLIQSKISFNQDLIELERAKGTLLSKFGINHVPSVDLTLEPVSLKNVQE
jgi:outer membrane protein TolC